MGNRQNDRASELFTDDELQLFVELAIEGCRGLVEYHDTRVTQ